MRVLHTFQALCVILATQITSVGSALAEYQEDDRPRDDAHQDTPDPDFIVSIETRGQGEEFVMAIKVEVLSNPYANASIFVVSSYHVYSPRTLRLASGFSDANAVGNTDVLINESSFHLKRSFGKKKDELQLFLNERGWVTYTVVLTPVQPKVFRRDEVDEIRTAGKSVLAMAVTIDPQGDSVKRKFKGYWKKGNDEGEANPSAK